MSGWERMARALLPGATKHIDHWNETRLQELNRNAQVNAGAQIREVITEFDFMLWDLEWDDE